MKVAPPILDGVADKRVGPTPTTGHLRMVQEVIGLWVQMQSRLQEHFAALAAEHSLSAIQAKILIQLDPAGTVTMRALADRIRYDPSNLTTVIDRLAKGLVLTDEGLSLRDAFWQRLSNEVGPLGGLDMKELAQLRSLLQLALAGSDHATC